MLSWKAPGWLLLALSACASDEDAGPSSAERGGLLPLQAQPPSSALATFVDPDTGFSTQSVHDVDREVIHFDSEQGAMIWGADGATVSGWTTSDNELRWNGSAGFRVRFGTEAGERRAYFTESGPGTICDLNIRGPERLSISATRETPPQP